MMTLSSPGHNPCRGEVWTVGLDPTSGDEMAKTRPCVIIGVDSMRRLSLRVVIPFTKWKPDFDTAPWHVRVDPTPSNGLAKVSSADANQIRSVSTDRFVRRVGVLDAASVEDIAAAVGIVVGL